jgi:2-polyprenyl-3-methyl-5-hydroxy-6-metoxy-1,4-benzoquinol methylase
VNRIEHIRAEEKRYHNSCYENHHLYEAGTWLHKPVNTIIDVLEQFKQYEVLTVLDLGSGIGRNSIPIAESLKDRSGKVVCVDILESAIEKLKANCAKFGVLPYIEGRLSDIESFEIGLEAYDLIIAVSTLEHVSSESALERKISEMITGTKSHGVNCIIIGSNIKEVTKMTNIALDPMFEVNLSTERMLEILDHQYQGWEIQSRFFKPLEYDIERSGQPVKLTMDCITLVAKKN